MICTVAAALRGGPINRVDIESDIQMKSHKSAVREVALPLKRPNRKGNVTENYEGSGCPINCGTRRINYARGVRIRTSHDPFPALSFSLSAFLPWRHLQVQRPTYCRVTVASRGQCCVLLPLGRGMRACILKGDHHRREDRQNPHTANEAATAEEPHVDRKNRPMIVLICIRVLCAGYR